jgi:epoxyqueuosine reductase
MPAEKMPKAIYKRLEKEGCKGKLISIEHVNELQKELEAHHQNGLLDEDLYDEYLNRFDFNVLDDYPDARSLIIVTAPQPQVRVTFKWNGQSLPCIIPPTYSLATDHQLKDCIEDILKPEGYHLGKKRLPEKLLAAHSGLARYGKNNITYVPGMGSFHRLAVFVTDLPCLEDNWVILKTLKSCEECTACMDACPTGAIVSDRFLVHAERCITFHNERRPEFPQWLDPVWHNCLVGCMYCQNACPMNKKFVNWIEDGMAFSEEETAYFLKGLSKDDIPNTTIDKLEKLGMMEYVNVLGRNLKVLLENQ